MARTSPRGGGLLRQVFVIAAVITAVLSLDATVVLLTPVVLVSVRRLRTPVRPYAYATAHLANAASLLLPVSNLTNLLAFHAAKLSFAKFTLLMALPWLAAVAALYAVFRVFFARDLRQPPDPEQVGPAPPATRFRFAGGGADAHRLRLLAIRGRGTSLGGARRSHGARGA